METKELITSSFKYYRHVVSVASFVLHKSNLTYHPPVPPELHPPPIAT